MYGSRSQVVVVRKYLASIAKDLDESRYISLNGPVYEMNKG